MAERTLSDEDCKAIALELISQVREQKHEFWIDPEKHYQDHVKVRHFTDDDIHSLADLAKAWRGARGLFWKAFLGFALVGALILAAFGLGFKEAGGG